MRVDIFYETISAITDAVLDEVRHFSYKHACAVQNSATQVFLFLIYMFLTLTAINLALVPVDC
ncbi:hypothetical protein FRC0077_01934 [Corynebacterium diphtheriae]|nr:hypothetical protein FRC0076_01924 [Corynebacterium diphtheriae]CAB0709632.1 hypothetical protein FRC0077_01934 [Corynebacterium diphtheriae]